MNNNHDDKKDKTEETFINNLFDKKEKDQNEQLYKNEFYILEEEIKSKKNQNSLQFMHDILLNKLMLEDYVPFPPKNDEPIIVNNQKEEKKKEDDQDKLIEEENEFLRSLHKINYLTFSPFGLSFFEDVGKDKTTINDDLMKEKEEKILQMIDFNYDNFEVTNDLLLNICQGFIDINRLKEENLTRNKEKEKAKEKALINNINNKEENNKEIIPKQEKEKETLDKNEKEFLNEIKLKVNISFYKDFLQPCEEEFSEAKNKIERKLIMLHWKPKIKEMDNEYDLYLKEKQEKERKQKEEQMRLKEIERKKEKEKEEEQKNDEKLMKAFEDIINRNKRDKSQKKIKKQKKPFKPTNKSTLKSTSKSSNKAIDINPNQKHQVSKSPFNGMNRGNAFNIASNYLKKNYSKSQAKIKTIPKNYLK